VVDIENLRRHYALTLDAWTERFERNWDEIHAIDPQRFDERFRASGACTSWARRNFRSPTGYTHLFQIVYRQGQLHEGQLPDEPGIPVCLMPGRKHLGA